MENGSPDRGRFENSWHTETASDFASASFPAGRATPHTVRLILQRGKKLSSAWGNAFGLSWPIAWQIHDM
jgi:hypothetical protein